MLYIDITNSEVHIPSKETALYDYIVSSLENRGCHFVDHGGWGVTESKDSVHTYNKEEVLAEPAIVVWCQEGHTVKIGTRLWYHDLNIETPIVSCAVVATAEQADTVLDILYATLCSVNELISRYENDINNNKE